MFGAPGRPGSSVRSRSEGAALADLPALERALTLIFDLEPPVVDRHDGFLAGLNAIRQLTSQDANRSFGWLHI